MKAHFYVLTQDTSQETLEGCFDDHGLFILDHSFIFKYLFILKHFAKHFAEQGAKVYVHAQDKKQAEMLDDLLFQQADSFSSNTNIFSSNSFPPHNFPPHNLVGEGPYYGTPIEIGYHGAKPNRNRQVFINLAGIHNLSSSEQTRDINNSIFTQGSFAPNLVQVIDFVPCEPNAKESARARYKAYRQAGFSIETSDLHLTQADRNPSAN